MSWSAIILLFQALSWCEIHSLLVLVLTVLIMMVKHHTSQEHPSTIDPSITNTLLCSHSFINCLELDMFSCCNLHCRWTHVLTVKTRGMKHKFAHSQPVAASTCDQWNCWDEDLGHFLPLSFDFQWYLAVETGEWQQSNDSQHCRPHQINLTCGANA